MRTRRSVILAPALVGLVLAGCAGGPNAAAGPFPGAGDLPGWAPTGGVETFDGETIYDLVNGQADLFFVYGFGQVQVQEYQDEGGEGEVLGAEVWLLETPADAYGLFTASVAGEAAAIGNGGDADPGWRLAFWQGRAYVQVRSRREIDDAALWALAEAISAALPAGGERPALMDRLPEGMVARSERFFHQELSIQDEVWLGGANLLGLSGETDGALARYEVGGEVVWLLLIRYPDEAAASAGLAALEGGGIEEVAAAATDGALLGGVFGPVDGAAAEDLLAEALGEE